uniref:Uncharacterized protein n=1 Tax=Candidatus Kentrum sp. TC TaxID=2126339 RepID=A0A451ACU9_9GAMM|nr:MAG: hypothetical protein BECKTC1821F_GA0114240_11087 [Candidatus Kentron sp. TC]
MAHFPKAETKIQSLAHEIVTGLTSHTDLFPAPPVSVEALEAAIKNYTDAADAALEQQAAAEQAVATKNEALQALTDDMKMILRYAENITHCQPQDPGLGRTQGQNLLANTRPDPFPGSAQSRGRLDTTRLEGTHRRRQGRGL